MKKLLALVSALMLMILALVPLTNASAASGGSTMYVSSSNGKGVRMRDGASTDDRVLYNLGEGTKVSVISYVDGEWAYVSAEGHAGDGYVMRRFLSNTDPTSLRQSFRTVKQRTITVKPTRSGGYVNLRASASKGSASLRHMTRGTRLTVVAQSRAWFKVVDEFGTTGYVVKAYTTR